MAHLLKILCLRFRLQTKSAYPGLIFSPCFASRGVSLFASLVFLIPWQLESSRIVREQRVFVLPTCFCCGFDCLCGQRGLSHNHSHPPSLPVTPVDGHSFWQGSQMAQQVLFGLWPSEAVIDCVCKRLSNVSTVHEGWRALKMVLFLTAAPSSLGNAMNSRFKKLKIVETGKYN